MKFACERCGKRFASVDEPAPGRLYRIRCRCGNIIHISSPRADEPSGGFGARPDQQPRITGATPGQVTRPAPPGPRTVRGAVDATSRTRVPQPSPPILVPDVPAPPATGPDAAPPLAAPDEDSHALATPLSAISRARASEVPDLFEGIPDLPEASPAPELQPPAPETGEVPWPSPSDRSDAPTPFELAPDPFEAQASAPSFLDDDPFAVAAAQPERFDGAPVARRGVPPPAIQRDGYGPVEVSGSDRVPVVRAKKRKAPSIALAVAVPIVAGAAAFLWYQQTGAGLARVGATAGPRVAPLPPPAVRRAPARPPPETSSAASAAALDEEPGAAAPAVADPAAVAAPGPDAAPAPEPEAPPVAAARAPPEAARAAPPAEAPARLRRAARVERKPPASAPNPPRAAKRKVATAAPDAAPPAGAAEHPPAKTEPASGRQPPAPRAAAPPPAPLPAARKEEPPPTKAAQGLDPGAVRGIVARSRPALEACVERALRDPATASYAGQTAALLILVAPSGKADAALEDGDLDATAFAHCLRRAVQKMKFPQFKGEEVAARIVLQLGSAN